MKKSLCYIGIFILSLFIILPPLFRTVLKEDTTTIKNESNKVRQLSCVKYVETISMSYMNNDVNNIRYNYPIDENLENTYSYSTIKEALENAPGTLKQIIENKNSYFLDLKSDANKNSLSSNYQSDIETQKNFFTREGFTCTIIE